MRIVVFTADEANGGVKQLVTTITRTCIQLGHDTTVFFPKDKGIDIDKDVIDNVRYYKKSKSLNPFNKCAKIASHYVEKENPELVLMPEGSVFTIQMLINLNKSIKTGLIVHDVTPHPSNMGLKRILTYKFSCFISKFGLKKANTIILLSENSHNKFISLNPQFEYKSVLFTLGGHIPFTDNQHSQPKELTENGVNSEFVLFFGRIDKYKGVERLAQVYKDFEESRIEHLPLVIAGGGKLESLLERNLHDLKTVFLLNRFIDDKEMIWLFKNCRFVVLPYIQASQSGVLPISYAFGKPVVASNIDGIKENVEDGFTGLLVENNDELSQALLKLSNLDLTSMEQNCVNYSNHKYDWQKNVSQLIYTIKSK